MYLAIDTETGGIKPEQGNLLSLYLAVLDKNFKMIDELDLLVKPDTGGYLVTAEALRINKIDLVAHNEKALTYKQASNLIKFFLSRHATEDAKLTLLGQNTGFDVDFLTHCVVAPDLWKSLVNYSGALDVGTIANYLKLKGLLPKELKISLGAICKHLGIPTGQAHNAKSDVLMSIEAIKKLLLLK